MQVQPHPQPQPRPQPTPTLTLRGTLLILNISYEKRVSIRFTLDDWLTASEVGVSYCRAGVLPVEWAHCVGDGACLPSFFFHVDASASANVNLAANVIHLHPPRRPSLRHTHIHNIPL
ncbi:carbohydrate-binding module family 21 protein, partial [Ramaria rubella]